MYRGSTSWLCTATNTQPYRCRYSDATLAWLVLAFKWRAILQVSEQLRCSLPAEPSFPENACVMDAMWRPVLSCLVSAEFRSTQDRCWSTRDSQLCIWSTTIGWCECTRWHARDGTTLLLTHTSGTTSYQRSVKSLMKFNECTDSLNFGLQYLSKQAFVGKCSMAHRCNASPYLYRWSALGSAHP
jgi:hypothetical protein